MPRSRAAQPSLLPDTGELPIHPAAEAFRLMTDDELAELAADIKANGQLHPIALDAEGAIVDGRNRLRACRLAGVEPKFATLTSPDPLAYIVSANIARRNITKGQQAMALAVIYPEPQKGGRGKKRLGDPNVSADRLSLARAVLGHSAVLTQQVIAGSVSLDDAMARVRADRAAAESDETKLAEIRAERPDLAEMVDGQRLTLAGAYAAHAKEKADDAQREANRRETILRVSESAYSGATAWSSEEFAADVIELLDTDQEFREAFIRRLRIDPARGDVQEGACALASALKLINGG